MLLNVQDGRRVFKSGAAVRLRHEITFVGFGRTIVLVL